jgi:hypothetical protein
MVVTGAFMLVIGMFLLASNNKAKLNIIGKYQGNAGAVMTFVGALLLGIGVF